MTEFMPSVVAGFIKSCKRKPVLLADSFCWFRYFLPEQESRIRVSGTTTPLRRGLKTSCFHFNRGGLRSQPKFTSACYFPATSVLSRVYKHKTTPYLKDFISNSLHLQVKPVMPEKKHFERLPKTVIPKNYDLFLKPNLTKFTFEGKEKVQITINEPVEKIVLNAVELEVSSAELTTADGKVLTPERTLSTENETLTLDFGQALSPGEASLAITFTGTLNDKMKGFYRSKYTLNDEERYAAVTQFESTDARRCFPCWDEPAIKATFDITLDVPSNKVALSNMPVVNETTEGETKALKFATTPIMSTYLVAVVVGDFDYIEDTSTDGVKVRVYTPVGKQEQGRFALHVATKVLPYYKDYFNIAYPLPKMDLIAISDFSAGAMENWGLVTYREVCLLVDTENTSTVRKQWIALVVGHELAHQWFGNLVTMEWWTHLWLNEGYASFVEFLCVAHLFPEYDIWTQFVTDMYIPALELDCLNNSHPIEVPVGHPNEIEEIFDDISYNKGASVIRMLFNYIGDTDFRKGMHLYLTRHQYSNTFTEDLWQALQEASSKPVGDVMSTWTKQMGFPVITVEDVKQEGDKRTFTLSQAKFYAHAKEAQKESNGPLWLVPISFSKSGSASTPCLTTMLRERTMTVTVDDVKPQDWVKINPGTVGYYRTRYPASMLEQFKPAIQDKSLPPLDRLGLLDDLFALVQAGQSQTVEVLKLMEAMNQEDNYTVWCTISNCLGKLQTLLSNTDFEDKYKLYGLRLLKHIGQKLGWEKNPHESHLDTLLRSLVLSRLAMYGDEAVIAESKSRFQQHISGESQIPADLRSVVYQAVLGQADEDTYNTMIKLFKESDLQEERSRISHSLGCIKDEKLLGKVLDFAMSPDVRAQDTVFVIISVARTKQGRNLAWDFIKQNWATFLARYEGGSGLLARLVKRTTEDFASEVKAAEIEEFFKTHSAPGCDRSLQQTCESIRVNAAWLARDRDSVQAYLTNLLYEPAYLLIASSKDDQTPRH